MNFSDQVKGDNICLIIIAQESTFLDPEMGLTGAPSLVLFLPLWCAITVPRVP